MRRLFLLFIIVSLSLSAANAQSRLLQFGLYDQSTNAPVNDAHLFISNATFGSVSAIDGKCSLEIPEKITEDLVISHVAYNSRILNHELYGNLNTRDSVFLEPNGVNLSEVLVSADRDGKWNKYYKQFKKAFLGEGDEASKCEILNPEVLRFENLDAEFKATAVDVLKIRNDYLGYEIDFLLTGLTIENDGSKFYRGHAKFTDLLEEKKKKILKNREKVYLSSPRHFYKSLIEDRLEEDRYKIEVVHYESGIFKTIAVPAARDLITYDSLSGYYQLRFPEFLEVTNLHVKEVGLSKMPSKLSPLERARFSTSQAGPREKFNFVVSHLYKIEPYLMLNSDGNVINKQAVREYGYWAKKRMATTLPWDYGLTYGKDDEGKTADLIFEMPEQRSTASNLNLLLFKNLIYGNSSEKAQSFLNLKNFWKVEYTAPLLDVLRISSDPEMRSNIFSLLDEKIGEEKIPNYSEGLRWLWRRNPSYGDYYADLKAEIYQHVDKKFKSYFKDQQSTARIRLDEIVWGGVKQDGIPPLRYPKLIPVQQADYLGKDNIIFVINIDGEARAYPKRILAWHEFLVDQIAGKDIALVYCTLCGTAIAYDMKHKGILHELGTSGFLYRSNKLMYDQATQSLWSTIEGRPVLGPLSDQGIYLDSYPVQTTTWGDWKATNPDGKVLSLQTGHDRDYTEGAAYKDYFATDELMFPVPDIDNRLRNKDEVFIVRSDDLGLNPIAISIDFLRKKRLYQDIAGETPFVVLTEASGASRAYKNSGFEFASYKNGKLTDKDGNLWQVEEEELVSPGNVKLERLPAHNIFWFAWYNVYPETRLVD